MTYHDGFDRTVSEWLDEQAGRGAPGYLDEVLARTTRSRQRPWWSSLERWLPMQTTLRLAPVPRIAWLLLVLALAVALGVAVLAVGSRPRLPEPFGLAGNGVVVYGTTDGDIHAYNAATGTSSAIITGPTKDETPDLWVNGKTIRVLEIDSGKDVAPVFDGTNKGDGLPTWSPDGTRLVFNRWDGTENHLAVGPATGGHVVEMGPGFPDFTDGAVGAFSPDGFRVIARYGFDPEATWLLDPNGGPGERVLTGVSQSASWQRLAR